MPDKVRQTSLIGLLVVVLVVLGGYGQAEWNVYQRFVRPIAGMAYNFSTSLVPPNADKTSEVVTPKEISRNLKGLGYFGGGAKTTTGEKKITTFKESRVSPGLNFYISGHYPAARLMTNDGTLVHRWKAHWSKAFPNTSPEEAGLSREVEGLKTYTIWRNGALMSDGSVVAIYDGNGLVRINKDSEVLWSLPIAAHHDLWISPDETKIYTITYAPRIITRHGKKRVILDDRITIVDSETGRILRNISLYDALMNSDYEASFSRIGTHNLAGSGELFHTNDVDLITDPHDRVSPPFREGLALVSMKYMNALGLIDLSKPKFTWMLSGMTYQQHDPDLLSSGNLLVFDNRKKLSRVIEIDPLTQAIPWGYFGTEENGFYSECCGMNQRLPNGNTLITETGGGRAFEVTPSGEIVWEFANPHTAGQQKQLTVPLLVVKRYSRNYVSSWLNTGE